MNAPLRVVLIGANGRMGRTIRGCAAEDSRLTISAGLDYGDPLEPAIAECEAVIDFSAPEATAAVCEACGKHRKPLVLGTTGHDPTQKESVGAAARVVPVVFAANFSTGVNVLFALTRRAAESLGKEFDLDVVELHHRTKKDAPSGTAKRLLEILGEVRSDRETKAQSIRAGDIVGEHTVIFSGKGERLELTHRAGGRETFALGALRAACWVIEQPPGLYDMQAVLGLAR
jgi:4-hydroxy-tetrahydrodipicolinate reductase